MDKTVGGFMTDKRFKPMSCIRCGKELNTEFNSDGDAIRATGCKG